MAKGVEQVEWRLLTNAPAPTPDDVLEHVPLSPQRRKR